MSNEYHVDWVRLDNACSNCVRNAVQSPSQAAPEDTPRKQKRTMLATVEFGMRDSLVPTDENSSTSEQSPTESVGYIQSIFAHLSLVLSQVPDSAPLSPTNPSDSSKIY